MHINTPSQLSLSSFFFPCSNSKFWSEHIGSFELDWRINTSNNEETQSLWFLPFTAANSFLPNLACRKKDHSERSWPYMLPAQQLRWLDPVLSVVNSVASWRLYFCRLRHRKPYSKFLTCLLGTYGEHTSIEGNNRSTCTHIICDIIVQFVQQVENSACQWKCVIHKKKM